MIRSMDFSDVYYYCKLRYLHSELLTIIIKHQWCVKLIHGDVFQFLRFRLLSGGGGREAVGVGG